MLELIFQGFWEWLYSLVLECWEYFSSSLLDIMSMDFSYLETRMPVITTIEQSMLAIGWALLIGNLVFQAVRSMLTGLGFEGEDPKLLFTRTFVFAFLLLASPQICELCLNMTSVIIGILEVPDAVNITLADNASFAGLACAWLLVIICGIIVIAFNYKGLYPEATSIIFGAASILYGISEIAYLIWFRDSGKKASQLTDAIEVGDDEAIDAEIIE